MTGSSFAKGRGMTMLRHPLGLCVLLGLSLAGCEGGAPSNTAAPVNAADTLTPPLPVPSPTPEGEVKSIIRPAVHAEVAEAPEPEATPEPLSRTIGFPRSAALDDAARAALDALAQEARTRGGQSTPASVVPHPAQRKRGSRTVIWPNSVAISCRR